MITIIIPALNEEATIDKVVTFAKAAQGVTEVLVIDNHSTDHTAERAQNAGADVYSCLIRGKGNAMQEGISRARNDIIVFLDADIDPYPAQTIESLTQPLIDNRLDFTKSAFSRQAGRVTEMVAKPLLSLLFPKLTVYNQPLSGMIAVRKEWLQKITFASGYGVDIGILIDLHLLGCRMDQVTIGSLDNKMQSWRALSKMAKEVAATILDRAAQQPKGIANLRELKNLRVVRSQLERAINERLQHLNKLAIFDMDNTVLRGRFIDACATEFGFYDALLKTRSDVQDPVIMTKRIARLLKGHSRRELLAVADRIDLVDDAFDTVAELRQRGYIIGIVSDSYDFVAHHISRKIGADFALANELEFSGGVANGEVRIPSFFFRNPTSRCTHTLCKTNAVLELSHQYGIPLHQVVAVGDSLNDLCMIKKVGMGFAFCSDDERLNYSADHRICEPSFRAVLTNTALRKPTMQSRNEPKMAAPASH